jgi:glyoxylase-like metal-dependent hydrolase (beta-lactamase superfamily II)
MKNTKITDHIWSFYIGRPEDYLELIDKVDLDWPTRGAFQLGMSGYAIVNGENAIVYDTMTTLEQAEQIKEYLVSLGVRKFHVILSHWHLDHIVGSELYRHENIIGHVLTRESLKTHREAIETGTFWGPPPVNVVLPNITFQKRMDFYLGELKVELHHFNIHSPDSVILFLPSEEIIFTGDTLEDTLTYIEAPGDLPFHIQELQRLKNLEFRRILPNHGHPDVIVKGGYDETLIDATIEYITMMMKKAGFTYGSHIVVFINRI